MSGINVASSRLLLAEHGNRWYIERNGRKLCTISMEPLMIIANQNSMGSSETVLDMFLFGWNFHDGCTNINFSNSIHDQNCTNEETKEEERMNVWKCSENIFSSCRCWWWCLKYHTVYTHNPRARSVKNFVPYTRALSGVYFRPWVHQA